METKWISLTDWLKEPPDKKQTLENQTQELKQHSGIKEAARILREGGLVAFPTETVYGLGADGLNTEAAARIYEAKGRPSDNPLILHIARMEDLSGIVREIPKIALRLAERFWPGPLTMIFPKAACVPEGTTGGLNTVAVRMPKHPLALALIEAAGIPVAAPSANLSGRPSTTTAAHVREDMEGRIDSIVDGGAVGVELESTIVDVTGEKPMMLRPGYITKEMLEEVVGEVLLDPVIMAAQPEPNLKPKAPGMKYRHYAPKAEMFLCEGSSQAVVSYINQEAKKKRQEGKRLGVLATEQTREAYQADVVLSVGSRESEESIARHLFEVLRKFDEAEVDVIYSECFGEGTLGMAIMNRLRKAAGYRVVQIEEAAGVRREK